MTREELQDKKAEDDAMREAIGVAKKKNKDKAKKVVMKFVQAVVAAIPMFLIFIKILAVVIAVCIITTMFTTILDGGDGESTSTDEEYNSSLSDGSGGVDITTGDWIFSEEDIGKFINNYKTTNTALKNEMLSKINEIKQWQDETGYSAGLLITIAFEEAEQDATFDFDTLLNNPVLKEEKYKTIKEVIENYKKDDTASEFANEVENEMLETAREAGIIKNGDRAEAGDGYDTVYEKDGKMYRNYKQIKGSYQNYRWVGGTSGSTGTIYWDGCPLTCAAIIISGYTGKDKNPRTVVQETAPNGQYYPGYPNPEQYLTGYRVGTSRPLSHNYTELTSNQKQGLINHVISGKPVIIYVLGPIGNYYGAKGHSRFTNKEHWMVILDYNVSKNEVYISNPSGLKENENTGWINADDALTSCTEYILITN